MTTNRRRWKVWKQQRWAPKPYWVVTSPECHECGFSTHAEALAYADRMARTVEVTLPADPNKHAPYMGYEAGSDTPLYHQFGASDWEPSNRISLERSQIEPFALALLAHHYRNETP